MKILSDLIRKYKLTPMDIDKLYLSSLNYLIKKEKGEDGKLHTVVTTKTDNHKYNLQNNIIEDYLALLVDKDENSKYPRSMNLLHRSIDNDTALATDVLNYLEEDRKQEVESPYGFYSLYKQTESKNDYITGKLGIGPFALNNNNLILTLLYHVTFNPSRRSIMTTLGLNRLDRIVSQDGTNILSWLSAMINAHVDIAKDPWISRLNVNPFTYNITNLLFRTGFGANTLYFINLPIMKMAALAYTQAGASYMLENGSKYKRQQDAVDELAKLMFADHLKVQGHPFGELLKAVENPKSDIKLIQDLNDGIKRLFDSSKVKQLAKTYNQLTNDSARRAFVFEHSEDQALMYLAYKQFSKYAAALSNLVKYCKIDTKKQGKNMSEQYIYRLGYDDLFDPRGQSGALFNLASLADLKNKSYIGKKTENALNAARDILSPYFITSTDTFNRLVDKTLAATGHFGTQISPRTVSAVSQALTAAIKSEYFRDSSDRIAFVEGKPNYLHDLVNDSSERSKYSYNAKTGEITFKNLVYPLKSYMNGRVRLEYLGADNKMHYITGTITSITSLNSAVVMVGNQKIPYNLTGNAQLYDGANTIYDRLNRLLVYINSHRGLESLQRNQLLLMLIPGGDFVYQSPRDNKRGEVADTYEHAKFVKLQNFVDDGGINSNYIIDAWDDLLHYTNDNKNLENMIRTFARDLVYYAFITSGDSAGFSKMFKYVPLSWRTTKPSENEESYSEFMKRKLVEFNGDTVNQLSFSFDIDDVVLNNWFDNQFVPMYRLEEETENGVRSNFIASYHKSTNTNGAVELDSYPSILGAVRTSTTDQNLMEASINPKSAPRFIKIQRHNTAYNSQRKYTIYKLYEIARTLGGVEYPVYIKVNPKGNLFSGGFLITEYGRTDLPSYRADEYTVDEGVLEQWYKVDDFMQRVPAYLKATTKDYFNIIADLNREYGAFGMRGNVDDNTGLTSKISEQDDVDKQQLDDSDFEDSFMKHCKQ